MGGTRLPWQRRATASVLRVVDRLVPATGSVVIHSQPDLDDNSVALLRARPSDLPIRVLVDDMDGATRRARALGLGDIDLVRRRSARGLWHLLRATVCVTTHGLYGSQRRPGRHVVNLWHGEFGKLIGELAGEPRRHADWMPVSGSLSRLVRSAEFALPPSRIGIVGTPRQSMLSGAVLSSSAGPQVIWAPTYRRTQQGRARTDGSDTALTGTEGPDNPALIEALARHGATLWFRPHPADTAEHAAGHGGRVRSARDGALQDDGLTFYELLGRADILVTDYSSLWVDWLLTGRPAVSCCPDLADYRSGRGLVLEPHEAWFPGAVVTTVTDLARELDDLLSGRDRFVARRADLRAQLHTQHERPATESIWSHVCSVIRDDP